LNEPCRLDKCSVTAIPYLEGDHWRGEAENLLLQIESTLPELHELLGPHVFMCCLITAGWTSAA
jgi:hypothetical protein